MSRSPDQELLSAAKVELAAYAQAQADAFNRRFNDQYAARRNLLAYQEREGQQMDQLIEEIGRPPKNF